MQKKNLFFAFLLMGSLALSACAKKDSNFAARYAKNRMGATVVDGVKTQQAAEQAAAQGVEADIVGVKRYWTPEGQPGPRVVMATILINNTEFPVTSHHSGTEVVNGSVTVNGYNISYEAMCGDSSCNPYYASMKVYSNGRLVIQEGVRIFFEKNNQAQTDLYQWLPAGQELPFMGSDVQDTRGMVGYLNQYGANSGSGIIQ
ncbi:hypothetical protein EZJ49_10670 [Bdellovibrio bacteriovorus]|uniref:hypothetical protein n=1 Tax=Bdellovibrio bacteriovorus TaxID=959 RepID=UPI0021D1F5B8|nr:hypothetical protein [Bdellovibrio bacteriovorus]UXR63538.1 hypothetical protein EZJ49_10670 [Bdellovibrio bacteriovorus]